MTDSRTSRRALISAGVASIAALSGCSLREEQPASSRETATVPVPSALASRPASPEAVPGYTDPTRWTGRTLVLASWGGDYQEAQEVAFAAPFTLASGAGLQTEVADLDRLREQIEEQRVVWDLLTVPAETALELGREGLLEPINYDVVDQTRLFTEVALQYGVGAGFFSTVMIYPSSAPTAPKTWADFWNVLPPASTDGDLAPEQARSLRHSPVGTLEFALLADGVALDELYPLDIERAFASLDRIKPNVLRWYEDGKLPIELLLQGDVGMASAWNVRISQLEGIDGISLNWNGGMLSADMWVVPKGAPNRDVAMDFINFATRAQPAAVFSSMLPYGPVNRDAFQFIESARQAVLPSSEQNRKVQFAQNWAWWADNLVSLTARFEDWLLKEAPVGSPTPNG